MSTKLSKAGLLEQIAFLERELSIAKQMESKAVMTLNHLCIRAYNMIEKHEQNRIGARPCIWGIKGLLEGLAMVYAQPKLEKEADETQPSTEGDIKGENGEKPGSAG